MTDETPKKNSPDKLLDLGNLASFQFGPAWARDGGDKVKLPSRTSRHGEDRAGDSSPRRGTRDGFAPRGTKDADKSRGRHFEGRDDSRRFSRDRRNGDRGRQDDRRQGGSRFSHPRREELPEPTEGLRVELRPVDILLANWAGEINKHRRVISLFEFAKVVMAARERYDLVFMKQEDGPQMIHSIKGDGSCWLTREEAVSFIWKAQWFGDFYTSVEEAVDPPKGEFQAIAKCSMTGDLIGPVNWHGYQPALMSLYKSKFSNMSIEHFRHKIEIEKGEEIVQAWISAVSKRVVWKPIREGAEDVTLETARALEQDFAEHFFDKAFEIVDKVFINGAIAKSHMSVGLWAHIVKLADTTRKHPSMLIPNLCHGLARHHMPIFKWKGGHHTGPSRPRAIAAETVLADRMASIIEWVKANPGKRVEALLNELGGTIAKPEKKEEQSFAETPISELAPSEPSSGESEIEVKRRDLISDLLWLSEQGYVLVFSDGTVNMQQVLLSSEKKEESADKDVPKKAAPKSVKKKPTGEKSSKEPKPPKAAKNPKTTKEPTEVKKGGKVKKVIPKAKVSGEVVEESAESSVS